MQLCVNGNLPWIIISCFAETIYKRALYDWKKKSNSLMGDNLMQNVFFVNPFFQSFPYNIHNHFLLLWNFLDTAWLWKVFKSLRAPFQIGLYMSYANCSFQDFFQSWALEPNQNKTLCSKQHWILGADEHGGMKIRCKSLQIFQVCHQALQPWKIEALKLHPDRI